MKIARENSKNEEILVKFFENFAKTSKKFQQNFRKAFEDLQEKF